MAGPRQYLTAATLAYMAASTLVLGTLLLDLRSETLKAARHLLEEVACQAADRVDVLLQHAEQALDLAQAALGRAPASGPEVEPGARAALKDMLGDRSGFDRVLLIDRSGRIVLSAGKDASTLDGAALRALGEAPPATGDIVLDRVTRDLPAGEQALMLVRPWRAGEGQVLGALLIFLRISVADRAGTDAGRGGIAIEVLPADQAGRQAGRDAGQWLSYVEALPRFPAFAIGASQSREIALAPWRQGRTIIVGVWLLATVGLGGLGLYLVKLWQARQAVQARYRVLFDAIPLSLGVIDRASGRYLSVNEAMVGAYGWSRSELLRMTPQELLVFEGSGPGRSAPGTGRARHRCKDGSIRDVELFQAPIEFGGRPALLEMARDVTDHLRAERERRAAEEQLHQAQKLEAIGQLTGGVSHDFNNILMVVLANLDALRDECTLDTRAQQHVTEIADATQRAADLVRHLLAFSRKQALDPQATDINQLVASTGRLLRRTLGETIDLEISQGEGLWLVEVDCAQLQTALVNLCLNARDAMPEGGRLSIATSNETLDSQAAGRRDLGPGDYVALVVRDSGTGIDPAIRSRLFEPFFSTKGPDRGAGLGLSMVYGFAKRFGGNVLVESAPGRGTVVTLYLPRQLRAAASEPAAAVPANADGGRILVVEDDPKVRDGVVQLIRSLGYSAEWAGDGVSGVETLRRAQTPFDLVLTDVIMPRGGGAVIADEVARGASATRILFMSGYPESARPRPGGETANVAVLSKPFRRHELATAIREALEGRAA